MIETGGRMIAVNYEEQLNLPEGSRGGGADKFTVQVARIAVQGGGVVELEAPGVTLIVGGNNAGKSTLLKQMHGRIVSSWSETSNATPPLLTSLDVATTGSKPDLYAWLAAEGHLHGDSLVRNGVRIYPALVDVVWDQSRLQGRFDSLGQVFALLLDARSRFAAVAATSRRADVAEHPSADLHHFEDDPALMAELDECAKEIFGVGLTLDPLSGNLLLRFGHVGVEAPKVDNVTPEYRHAVAALTPLELQGDGVSSALGLLIPILAGRRPIAFVDEPEAYLHPPQAYKLGQVVARIADRHRIQVVAATHDRNFVAGVLAHNDTSPTVIRLERHGNAASAHAVEPQRLRDIWSSALLRHSNILDGLFHRAVVVAEQERDCVFYQASLESAGSLPHELLPSDVLFVSAHGKGGIPEVATILSSAHVPVIAAVDIDALRDKVALKKIVDSVGGSWTAQLEKDLTASTAEFRIARKPLTRQQVLGSISAVLSEEGAKNYDSATQKEVKASLSLDDPWSSPKRHGLSAFLGDRPAADRLFAGLAEQGVVVVPVGELERFAPSVGVAKGKNWLPAALAAGAHETDAAIKFARALADGVIAAEARPAPSSVAPATDAVGGPLSP
jgi:energy-coupling factor transporter ATP-binding protein EcfA2